MSKTDMLKQTDFCFAQACKIGLICLLMGFALFTPGKARALTCISCCAASVVPVHIVTRDLIQTRHNTFRNDIFGVSAGAADPDPSVGRLQQHEDWLIEQYFKPLIQPALMMMTEQLVGIMAQQTFIVGTFIDAKVQLETQGLFQKLQARAHKDYYPSFGMCEIGTSTRSLAAAEFNSDFSRFVMNKRFMDRQTGTRGSVGAGGPDHDRASAEAATVPTPFNRLGLMLHKMCDDNDLNKVNNLPQTGLFLCQNDIETHGWVNRDIDWANTIMGPRTINVDFTTTFAESASDNERVLEMSNLLYGHKLFPRPHSSLLHSEQNQQAFINSRSVTAKRSVAQASFNAIVGLKSRGTRMTDGPAGRVASSADTDEFLYFFLEELGIPPGNIQQYREYMYQKAEAHEPNGATDPIRNEPSYYAQMEILAKKIYQRPEFYTELYDKPANVKRKSAAMQAIKLMLERDIFDSQLRAEAIMSMILELKVVEEQQNIENMLGLLKEQGG